MDIPAHGTPIAELAPTLARLRDAWQANRPSQQQRRDDLQRLRIDLRQRRQTDHLPHDLDPGDHGQHQGHGIHHTDHRARCNGLVILRHAQPLP